MILIRPSPIPRQARLQTTRGSPRNKFAILGAYSHDKSSSLYERSYGALHGKGKAGGGLCEQRFRQPALPSQIDGLD
jgi:hypothetical protein